MLVLEAIIIIAALVALIFLCAVVVPEILDRDRRKRENKQKIKLRFADFFHTKDVAELKRNIFLYGKELEKEDLAQLEQILIDQIIEEDDKLSSKNKH